MRYFVPPNAHSPAILKHQATLDGIMTYIEVIADFEHGGSKDAKKGQLLAELQVPYTRTYPGGLRAYVLRMDAIYAELSNLGTNYQEGEKCQQLTIGLSQHKDLLSTLQLYHTHPHTQTFTRVPRSS